MRADTPGLQRHLLALAMKLPAITRRWPDGPDAGGSGFFAERDGWRKCVNDLWGLNQRIATDHPGLPIVLIGHSMGSFMAQHFISEHGEALSGVVLAGSTVSQPG